MNKLPLSILIEIATQHVEDIESGLAEGIYHATDNEDLEAQKAAIVEAKAWVSKPDIWTKFMPVISTAHLTKENAQALTESPSNGHVANYREGCFIFIGSRTLREMGAVVESEHEARVGPEIIQWFLATYPEESWINFDADGDIVDGLPIYDW